MSGHSLDPARAAGSYTRRLNFLVVLALMMGAWACKPAVPSTPQTPTAKHDASSAALPARATAATPARTFTWFTPVGPIDPKTRFVGMVPRIVVGESIWQFVTDLRETQAGFARFDARLGRALFAWPLMADSPFRQVTAAAAQPNGDLILSGAIDSATRTVPMVRLRAAGGVEDLGALPYPVVALAAVEGGAIEAISVPVGKPPQRSRRALAATAWEATPLPAFARAYPAIARIEAAQRGPAGWTLWAVHIAAESDDLEIWRCAPDADWALAQQLPGLMAAPHSRHGSPLLVPGFGGVMPPFLQRASGLALVYDGHQWRPFAPPPGTDPEAHGTPTTLRLGEGGLQPTWQFGGAIDGYAGLPDGRWLRLHLHGGAIHAASVGAAEAPAPDSARAPSPAEPPTEAPTKTPPDAEAPRRPDDPGPAIAPEDSVFLLMQPSVVPTKNGEYIVVGGNGLYLRLSARLERVDTAPAGE